MSELQDTRPNPTCGHVPKSACAVAFDSHDCSAGWKLVIPEDEVMEFKFFTSYWKYRNDMDLIGIKPGCFATVYNVGYGYDYYSDSYQKRAKFILDAPPDNEKYSKH